MDKPSPISPGVQGQLNRQLTHELQASQAYLAMSLWSAANQYPGFAEFFEKQAGEEREHAGKMMKHLSDRGATPRIGALEAPKADFDNLMELALLAQHLERANTAGINEAYEAALAQKDYPAQIMLQWFIMEQVEEEAWTDDLVEYVRRASCAGGLSQLDRHVVELMSDDED